MKKFSSAAYVLIITLVLFAGGAWFLIKNEVVHFSFIDQFIQEQSIRKAQKSDMKVLVLGDSQLEKWPMEHCLYKDMSDYFDEKGIGYINAAHFGFGPIEYEDQLKQIIPFYKPNIILIYYYAGNDLTDVSYRMKKEPKKRVRQLLFKTEIQEESAFESSRGKIEDTFDWDLFEEKGIDPEIIQYARNRINNPHVIGPEYVNPHILAIGSWKPDNHYDNCTLKNVRSKYGWYISLQRFEGIMKMADSINAKVGLIVIPSNVQVDTSHYAFYRKTKFNISDDLLFSNAPQKELYEFSKASQISYLDLLPFFKTYSNSEELYFENDDHLSEKGHLLAFDVVKERIIEPLILDTNTLFRSRKRDFYLKNKKWVVRYQMEVIESDTNWYNSIKEKAIANNLPVDSQLYLDAKYVIEN